ncbi:hypothetical protein BST91_00125 [Nonlabens tegetincola]|uniref:HTTM domain-containing protein n=1 Tax=Nonlabens tegetincola TaxID=323273 RepID=UPI000A209412|nr:HTTM domain-containing protein [Nonlabens tegetincola]ARN70177.1 hypothetical protein BST91_00125 [Nonlabens tegetincola]
MRETINKWFFTQVDNSALVVFRMVYGLILTCEAFGSIALGAVKRLFIDTEFTFTFIGFEFLEPLPGYGMYVLYSAMGIAGIFIMLGYKYRMAMLFYAITWTYAYLLQKSSYNNHCYLIMLLNWLLVFLPAHKAGSIDAKKNKELLKIHMSRWIYILIIGFVWIVYSYASIAKFYPDWLDGSFEKFLMSTRGRDYEILQQDWAHVAILYYGLLFDLIIVPLLLWKRTRWIAIIASVFFHLFNSIVFKIGVFPYLALSFLLFFLTTETVHKRFLSKKTFYAAREVIVPKHAGIIKVFTISFLLIMLVLPLRHWVIEDDVLWTEEGHRLSWRMMLRSRSGRAVYYVENKETGKRERVNIKERLSRKQFNSANTKPDFMWQLAQRLKKEYADKGEDVAVYISSSVSINGRPRSKFTNDTIDIASQPWSQFKHATWLMPSPLQDTPTNRP